MEPVEKSLKNSLEITRGKNDCFLLCDFGALSPESFARSLDFLKRQSWTPDISAVLGFDLSRVDDPDGYLRPIGGMLRRMEFKHLLCFGPQIEQYRYAFPKLSLLYNDLEDALADLPKFDFQNESVLIKAPESFSPRRIESLMQRRSTTPCWKSI